MPISTGRDLFEGSNGRAHPSRTLYVQVPYQEATTYHINPLDLTKLWPHSDYPLIKVGRWLSIGIREFFRPDRTSGPFSW